VTDTRNYPKIAEGLRRRAQAAEARVEGLHRTVEEQNAMLLGIVLRDVLADPADFARFVDVDRLRSADGGLVWAEVRAALGVLLDERPYLAAPQTNDPRPRGRNALRSLLTGA
jgi:hypothetical protein